MDKKDTNTPIIAEENEKEAQLLSEFLLQFKASLEGKTLEEMQTLHDELETQIYKMVLESDVVSKLIVLEGVMQTKLEEEERCDGKA